MSVAHAQTNFKVAYWNIQSGKGEPAIAGHTAHFADTQNCTDPSQPMNAWGIDFVQQELRTKIRDDTSIIALGLAESYTACGNPTNVKNVLGWAAATESRNGTAVVARYGFAETPQWQQLTNTNAQETMWVVRTKVYTNSAHTQTIDLYTTHWFASSDPATIYDQQAQETVNFLQTSSGSGARVLIGDLNVWEGTSTCGQDPQPAGLSRLRAATYVDAWPTVHGTAEGFTGMTNRQYGTGFYCGNPPGYTWKRVDYGWSKGFTPTSMTRFGVPSVIGDDAPSDHYGIIVGYGSPDTTPPSTSITAPVEAATVSNTVTVSMTASDDVGVTSVELLRDGTVIRTLTSPPYQTSWDTTAETNGAHQLRSRAFDAAGHSTLSAARNVTVNNTTTGPGEIVLWASRASVRAGDWQAVSDRKSVV